MKFTTYTEAIDWLFQQFPSYQNIGGKAYKPGLENIRTLLAHFGNPQDQLKFIHVAGTNGKGSTSSMLASILTESNEKVGLFTSPHINDFRERIRINGQTISEEKVISWTNQIIQAELNFEPSFFEITFLLALLYFNEQKCSVCVIETGLGGRLDATNVITPILSLITNISLEHTNFLGNTIEEIASEKGGIIKPNTPVIIGERDINSSPIFENIAQQNDSPIYFSEDEQLGKHYKIPLLGEYQLKNFDLVMSALKLLQQQDFTITERSIEAGLANLVTNTGFHGRLQVISTHPRVIFDVSHNEAGIKATLDYFSEEHDLVVVYGTSSDKDLDAIFKHFSKKTRFFMTTFSSERSATVEKLRLFSEKHNLKSTFFEDPNMALQEAKSTANESSTILVFGSFFLIADFFKK